MILEKGDSFSGFTVEESVDKESGRVWVFSKGNEAVVIGLPYNEYFDLLLNPWDREAMLDQLALRLHQEFRDKSKKITSLQSNQG